MVNLDWTTLTLAVIAIFALAGFFRGWWKEAISTGFLVFMLLLLQNPSLAQTVINLVNTIIEALGGVVPASLLPTFESVFGIQSGRIPVIDASAAGTWLIALMFVMVVSTLFARYTLAGHDASPVGSILGGLLGGFNGFVFMGLIREYLDGRSLPGVDQSALVLPSEIAQNTAGRAVASSGVAVTATNLPNVTILDSYIPWVLIIVGVGVLLMAFKNRVGYKKSDKGFRKIYIKQPYGYRR